MQQKQGCFAALISTLLIGCANSNPAQPIANNSPASVTIPLDYTNDNTDNNTDNNNNTGTEHELVTLLKHNRIRVDKNPYGDDIIYDSPQCRQLIVQYRRTMKQRLDIAAQNIANINTTCDIDGKPNPYRRQFVQLTSIGTGAIQTDLSPFILRFEPADHAADKDGYVRSPNVDKTLELVNSISATECYELATAILCKFDPSYITVPRRRE